MGATMSESDTEKARKDRDVHEQEMTCQAWRQYFHNWAAVHYVTGLLAIALSTYNAINPFELTQDAPAMKICAWALAFLTAAITFLQPGERFSRYRRAWTVLRSALTLYRADRTGKFKASRVVAAYLRGEEIIHQTVGTEGAGVPPAGDEKE